MSVKIRDLLENLVRLFADFDSGYLANSELAAFGDCCQWVDNCQKCAARVRMKRNCYRATRPSLTGNRDQVDRWAQQKEFTELTKIGSTVRIHPETVT